MFRPRRFFRSKGESTYLLEDIPVGLFRLCAEPGPQECLAPKDIRVFRCRRFLHRNDRKGGALLARQFLHIQKRIFLGTALAFYERPRFFLVQPRFLRLNQTERCSTADFLHGCA